MIPNDETVRVLRAIHALLADALTSPDRGPGATESDAGPSEAAPEDPPTPERSSGGESDEALAQDDRRVNVTITDVYAAPAEHGFLRINVGPATAVIDQNARNVTVTDVSDDLPGEPVESGDLRAGDRVAFTYREERITCALVGHQDGDVLCSDVPDSTGYAPDVVYCREWANVISDVRLIERAPREDDDPDEALADLIGKTLWPDDPPWAERGTEARERLVEAARTAREHLAAERAARTWGAAEKDLALHERAEKAESEADRLRHERDDAKVEAERLRGLSLGDLRRAVEAERERDDWQAKHEALRADVDRMLADQRAWSFTRREVMVLLDRDAARAPSGDHHEIGSKCQRDHCEEMHEPDADTVTLPREVVFDLLHEWEADPSVQVYPRVGEVSGIVRAALGWGGSDE